MCLCVSVCVCACARARVCVPVREVWQGVFRPHTMHFYDEMPRARHLYRFLAPYGLGLFTI